MTGPPAWFVEDVSRETLEKLDAYAALLKKWTQKINLIASASVPDIMDRHIWDSAQAYDLTAGTWVDFGSGGGLPGIVISILRQNASIEGKTVLLESDQRKCTFLRSCARELELDVDVRSARIEQVPGINAAVVSARACAALPTLLAYAHQHMASDGSAILLKGASWKSEIEAAKVNWRFSFDATPSKTRPEAAILHIRNIERV